MKLECNDAEIKNITIIDPDLLAGYENHCDLVVWLGHPDDHHHHDGMIQVDYHFRHVVVVVDHLADKMVPTHTLDHHGPDAVLVSQSLHLVDHPYLVSDLNLVDEMVVVDLLYRECLEKNLIQDQNHVVVMAVGQSYHGLYDVGEVHIDPLGHLYPDHVVVALSWDH